MFAMLDSRFCAACLRSKLCLHSTEPCCRAKSLDQLFQSLQANRHTHTRYKTGIGFKTEFFPTQDAKINCDPLMFF